MAMSRALTPSAAALCSFRRLKERSKNGNSSPALRKLPKLLNSISPASSRVWLREDAQNLLFIARPAEANWNDHRQKALLRLRSRSPACPDRICGESVSDFPRALCSRQGRVYHSEC